MTSSIVPTFINLTLHFLILISYVLTLKLFILSRIQILFFFVSGSSAHHQPIKRPELKEVLYNITYVLFYSKTNILSLQDVIITRSMFFSHICYNLLK